MMLFETKTFKKNDYYWTEYCPSSKKIGSFIFLHGFPSWKTKNQDIAENLCNMGYKVYLPHHIGLGFSEGIFSFKDSINQTQEFIEKYVQEEDRENLNVLGHSWGGFLALTLSLKLKNVCVLLAPLIQFPGDHELEALIQALYEAYPTDCTNYSLESMIDEWWELKKQYNFFKENFVPQYKKTLILHGRKDDIIPITPSTEFHKKFAGICDLKVTNDDHLLCDGRKANIRHILEWMKNNDN